MNVVFITVIFNEELTPVKIGEEAVCEILVNGLECKNRKEK